MSSHASFSFWVLFIAWLLIVFANGCHSNRTWNQTMHHRLRRSLVPQKLSCCWFFRERIICLLQVLIFFCYRSFMHFDRDPPGLRVFVSHLGWRVAIYKLTTRPKLVLINSFCVLKSAFVKIFINLAVQVIFKGCIRVIFYYMLLWSKWTFWSAFHYRSINWDVLIVNCWLRGLY